jgi:hypothetical protein
MLEMKTQTRMVTNRRDTVPKTAAYSRLLFLLLAAMTILTPSGTAQRLGAFSRKALSFLWYELQRIEPLRGAK